MHNDDLFAFYLHFIFECWQVECLAESKNIIHKRYCLYSCIYTELNTRSERAYHLSREVQAKLGPIGEKQQHVRFELNFLSYVLNEILLNYNKYIHIFRATHTYLCIYSDSIHCSTSSSADIYYLFYTTSVKIKLVQVHTVTRQVWTILPETGSTHH